MQEKIFVAGNDINFKKGAERVAWHMDKLRHDSLKKFADITLFQYRTTSED